MKTQIHTPLLLALLLALLPSCVSITPFEEGPAVNFGLHAPFPPAPYWPLAMLVDESNMDGPDYIVAKGGVDSSHQTPNRIWDHWNAESVPPRVVRFFFGYDSNIDGPHIINKWKDDGAHVNRTLKRMFFHHNEDNPFQN